MNAFEQFPQNSEVPEAKTIQPESPWQRRRKAFFRNLAGQLKITMALTLATATTYEQGFQRGLSEQYGAPGGGGQEQKNIVEGSSKEEVLAAEEVVDQAIQAGMSSEDINKKELKDALDTLEKQDLPEATIKLINLLAESSEADIQLLAMDALMRNEQFRLQELVKKSVREGTPESIVASDESVTMALGHLVAEGKVQSEAVQQRALELLAERGEEGRKELKNIEAELAQRQQAIKKALGK